MRNIFLAVLHVLFYLNVFAVDNNEKPFVIPELREWHGGSGHICIKRNVKSVIVSNDSLGSVATRFIADFEIMTGQKLKLEHNVHDKRKSVVFNILDDNELGKEGYQIEIADAIIVQANSTVGLHWATQTLLQMIEQSKDNTLPCGIIRDYPDYPLRGFVLDCARKFIPLDYLQNYIRIMSYYKMNTLQMHLNDNGLPKFFGDRWEDTYSAFRLESDVFPGLTAKDGHYTKSEFIDLQLYAKSLGVEIIPEIDVPAHSLAFTHYKPQLASQYGMNYLDLFKDETYQFVDKLFDEYLSGDNPIFIGDRVHIGNDEYKASSEQVVNEKFRYFTDRYIRYVESYGKQACVWGALSAASGETKVKSQNVIMNIWHSPFAQPVDMVDEGFSIINIPEINYIVPIGNYYNDYMNYRQIYDSWTPAKFGSVIFDEKHKSILGGMFAVWNDGVGNGISVKDIHDRSFKALQTIATKTWASSYVTSTYDEFETNAISISEAPGVNIAGRISDGKKLIYKCRHLQPNKIIPYEEIGYDYTISFDIHWQAEVRGTVLFKSDHATFYLSNPSNGSMGFSREGYNFSLNMYPQNDSIMNVVIKGDNRSLELSVNGEVIDNLCVEHIPVSEGLIKKHIKTLVFPLSRSGKFNSKITNFRIYNYKL